VSSHPQPIAPRRINVLSVHWRSATWLQIQLGALHEHLDEPWSLLIASTEPDARGIATYCEDLPGTHAEKLNALASVAASGAHDDDILMFIDGDAFPVRPLRAWVESLLAAAPLAAVVRVENLGDPQPHPCFCVTTVGFWSRLPGDWQSGPKWMNSVGRHVTDVGARMLEHLRTSDSHWIPIFRANARDWHPVLFGLYGEGGMVYHHGAGFREAVTRVDVFGDKDGNGDTTHIGDTSAARRNEIDEENAPLSAKVLDALRHDRSAVLRLFGEQ
jgi:hypothetical protein